MRIKLLSLTLVCREKQEVIEFSPQVSFFHGKMSAGKSTIARLIDYCLGAKDIERTTAISKELVAVELAAQIEKYAVIFERTADPAGNVQVSWTDDAGSEFSVLAPLKEPSNPQPIVGTEVFTFSDLMFFFFGMEPLRVRRSSLDEESPMVRLSFRDIFWYCYLEQNRIDNSFYRLHETYIQTKSRYAIRYILGYYTERLETLQGQLTKAINDRTEKLAAARQLREFLQEVGYDSETAIQADLHEVNRQLDGARLEQSEVQSSHHAETHFADDLREQLRQLSGNLGNEEQSLSDLQQRLAELKSLKSELTTARQKLSRVSAATAVLSGVRFESCPQCGTKLQTGNVDSSNCTLCGNHPTQPDENRGKQTQVVRRDIESRLNEIEDTITRSQRSVRKQEQAVETLKQTKRALDRQLEDMLQQYDSAFLAKAREADRRVAMLEERLRGLDRFRKLPEVIQRLSNEASQLLTEQDQLREKIQQEIASLSSVDAIIRELEETYIGILLAIGVPGVNPDDRVVLNRTTWIPDILEAGEEGQRWNFYTAGSNGKKTLLNVCYALAVHQVAEAHNRPLPTLLMIDHPMKCTSPDVNRDVFEAFYNHLYGLVRGPLKNTQIILIDNDYFSPDENDIEHLQRYMTPNDDAHPPLITYYRGA